MALFRFFWAFQQRELVSRKDKYPLTLADYCNYIMIYPWAMRPPTNDGELYPTWLLSITSQVTTTRLSQLRFPALYHSPAHQTQKACSSSSYSCSIDAAFLCCWLLRNSPSRFIPGPKTQGALLLPKVLLPLTRVVASRWELVQNCREIVWPGIHVFLQ